MEKLKKRIVILCALALFVLPMTASGYSGNTDLLPDTDQIYGSSVTWSLTNGEAGGWISGKCVLDNGAVVTWGPGWYYPYYNYYVTTTFSWPWYGPISASCTFIYEDAFKVTNCYRNVYPPLYSCMLKKTLDRITFRVIA